MTADEFGARPVTLEQLLGWALGVVGAAGVLGLAWRRLLR